MGEAEYPFRAQRDRIFKSGLPPTLRHLLMVLLDHMPNCRPSGQLLAAETGLHRATIVESIAQLEKLGWLVVSRRMGERSCYQFGQGVPVAQDDTHLSSTATPTSRPGRHPPVVHGDRTSRPGRHPPVVLDDPKRKDPDLKRKRSGSAPLPEEGGGTTLPVYFNLQGWTPDPSLAAEAEMQGIPPQVFADRLADLRNGPIGGVRGVFDRADYVRRQFPKWRTWAEVDRGKEWRRRSDGPKPEDEQPQDTRSKLLRESMWHLKQGDLNEYNRTEEQLRRLDAAGARPAAQVGNADGRPGRTPGERAARAG